MPRKQIEFGTKVEFRRKPARAHQVNDIETRYFAHVDHSDVANKFVREHRKDWDYFILQPFGVP
jgi:hypothetical protein